MRVMWNNTGEKVSYTAKEWRNERICLKNIFSIDESLGKMDSGWARVWRRGMSELGVMECNRAVTVPVCYIAWGWTRVVGCSRLKAPSDLWRLQGTDLTQGWIHTHSPGLPLRFTPPVVSPLQMATQLPSCSGWGPASSLMCFSPPAGLMSDQAANPVALTSTQHATTSPPPHPLSHFIITISPWGPLAHPWPASTASFPQDKGVVVAVVQSLRCVRLFASPGTAARQAPLSPTVSRSLLRFMSIESVMPSNHLILCRPLLLLPSIFPSIR